MFSNSIIDSIPPVAAVFKLGIISAENLLRSFTSRKHCKAIVSNPYMRKLS
jgi:hypothetical protein